MDFHNYLNGEKELQSCLLRFLDQDGINDEDFESLIKLIDEQNIRGSRSEIKDFFYLISKISTYHHRTPDFANKIDKILSSFLKELKENFSNIEIFNIFKRNKRVLLFLIQNDSFTIDESIASTMLKLKYRKLKYPHYFYPEIKSFITDEKQQRDIQKEVDKQTNGGSDIFEQKRKTGENDNKICEIIRNDSINDFTSHVTQNKLSLYSTIEHSIFETSPLLVKGEPTLLDYAAFYGSIQIFNFLKDNSKITADSWIYGIHGQNLEIIQSFESHHIRPRDVTYTNCLRESFKCHHNEIAAYIKEKLLDVREARVHQVYCECIKFYDYNNFPEDLNDQVAFIYLCQADNAKLVDELLKLQKKNFKINEKIENIIQNNFF